MKGTKWYERHFILSFESGITSLVSSRRCAPISSDERAAPHGSTRGARGSVHAWSTSLELRDSVEFSETPVRNDEMEEGTDDPGEGRIKGCSVLGNRTSKPTDKETGVE
ncbi:hypothetical protein BJ165DRAFT_929492 [Panaeolus papilionaceus]|nr:hypothetical protein BJ165DRAFT_929492 [Panaeolus papilionaceus]